MYFLLVTLHVLICGLLIIVIMLQSGEAADLAGAFGGAGSQTAFGPRGAATFLSKATTWCAIMFMLTSMALTMHQNTVVASAGSSVLQQFSKTSKTPAPAAPAAPSGQVPAAPTAPASAPAAPASAPEAPASPAPAPSK
ncbi:MAG: preprotein translocase subunit SecG [Acidobacteriia bacterium]|nr:preprotein translocase subunit SecG [Terriglobia bacterium]